MISKNIEFTTFLTNNVVVALLVGLFSVLVGFGIGRGVTNSASLIILVVLFLPLLMLIVRQPHIGLGLTLASVLFEFALPRLPLIGTTTSLLGLFTLAAFLGKRLIEKPKILFSRRSTLYIFIVAFLGSAIIGEIIVLQMSVSRSWLFTYLQLAVLTWLTIEILQTRQQVLSVLKILLSGILVTVFVGVWQFANATLDTTFFRASGLVGNANAFSVYTSLGVAIAYFFYHAERTPLKQKFFLGIVILSVAAVIISGSRGGSLFLALIMIFLILRMERGLGNKVKFVVLVLASIWVLSFYLSDDYFDRILQIPQNIVLQEDTLGTRVMLWEAGVRMWQTSPIFGIGNGGFAPLLVQYKPEDLQRDVITAHNMYVTILAENGIVGIVPFVSIIVFTIIILWRVEYRATISNDRLLVLLSVVAQAMLFVILLNGGKGNWHYEKILWFIFGLAVAIESIATAKMRPRTSYSFQ